MIIKKKVEVEIEIDANVVEKFAVQSQDIVFKMRLALLCVQSLTPENFQEVRDFMKVDDPRVALLEKWKQDFETVKEKVSL